MGNLPLLSKQLLSTLLPAVSKTRQAPEQLGNLKRNTNPQSAWSVTRGRFLQFPAKSGCENVQTHGALHGSSVIVFLLRITNQYLKTQLYLDILSSKLAKVCKKQCWNFERLWTSSCYMERFQACSLLTAWVLTFIACTKQLYATVRIDDRSAEFSNLRICEKYPMYANQGLTKLNSIQENSEKQMHVSAFFTEEANRKVPRVSCRVNL